MRTSIRLIGTGAVALTVLAGCGKHDGTKTTTTEPGTPGAKKITICLLPKAKGSPYFTSCAEGAANAAKELGTVNLVYDGPTDGSPEKQASMIEQWTLQGVDVIAISPNDPAVLASSMKAARAKGVKVITWDADCDQSAREFFVNQATAEDIGNALVDTMAKDLGGAQASGDVAIITARLTAANQNAWMEHMKTRLKKYPSLNLVAVKPSNEDQKLAFQVAQDLMKVYPNLKGLFAISSMAFPAAAEAIRQSGKKGQVLVTGLSTPANMKEFVKDGTVKSVILWNTVDLGYLTICAAEALKNGSLKAGDTTFNARTLGTKTIAADNILLGKIMVFTSENIDQFNF